MSEHPITHATTAGASEEGHKVFVGNLSFNTDSQNLRDLFAGKGAIKDAQIISRGRRSLGYGFVTFENEADAAAAISSVDKTELNGRVINCEIAKPPSNTKRGNIAQEAAAAAGGETSTAEYETTSAPRGRGGRRGRGARRGGRGGRRPAADGEAEPAGELTEQMGNLQVNNSEARIDDQQAEEGQAQGESSGRGRRRGRGRGGRGRGGDRPPRAPLSGEESKTMVFVANLPFSFDDEALKNIFQGYNIKTATVVTRKRGPAEGKSKGFGFVDFSSQEEQKKAVEQFGNFQIDGREIQCKIAMESVPHEQQQETTAE